MTEIYYDVTIHMDIRRLPEGVMRTASMTVSGPEGIRAVKQLCEFRPRKNKRVKVRRIA